MGWDPHSEIRNIPGVASYFTPFWKTIKTLFALVDGSHVISCIQNQIFITRSSGNCHEPKIQDTYMLLVIAIPNPSVVIQ